MKPPPTKKETNRAKSREVPHAHDFKEVGRGLNSTTYECECWKKTVDTFSVAL